MIPDYELRLGGRFDGELRSVFHWRSRLHCMTKQASKNGRAESTSDSCSGVGRLIQSRLDEGYGESGDGESASSPPRVEIDESALPVRASRPTSEMSTSILCYDIIPIDKVIGCYAEKN